MAGTFINRTGVISSVHAFSQPALGLAFFTFIGITFSGSHAPLLALGHALVRAQPGKPGLARNRLYPAKHALPGDRPGTGLLRIFKRPFLYYGIETPREPAVSPDLPGWRAILPVLSPQQAAPTREPYDALDERRSLLPRS